MKPQAQLGYILAIGLSVLIGVLSYFYMDVAKYIYFSVLALLLIVALWFNWFAKNITLKPHLENQIKILDLWDFHQKHALFIHFPTFSLFASGFIGFFSGCSLIVMIVLLFKGFYWTGGFLFIYFNLIQNYVRKFDPKHLGPKPELDAPAFALIGRVLDKPYL